MSELIKGYSAVVELLPQLFSKTVQNLKTRLCFLFRWCSSKCTNIHTHCMQEDCCRWSHGHTIMKLFYFYDLFKKKSGPVMWLLCMHKLQSNCLNAQCWCFVTFLSLFIYLFWMDTHSSLSVKTVCAGNMAPVWACWKTMFQINTPATSAETHQVRRRNNNFSIKHL